MTPLRSRLFAGTALAGILLSGPVLAGAAAPTTFPDPIAVTPVLGPDTIMVDGLFSDPLFGGKGSPFFDPVTGIVDGGLEWGGAEPLLFKAPGVGGLFDEDFGGLELATSLKDANSLVLAAIAEDFAGIPKLFLMYDFEERTIPDFAMGDGPDLPAPFDPGEFVMDIFFPIDSTDGLGDEFPGPLSISEPVPFVGPIAVQITGGPSAGGPTDCLTADGGFQAFVSPLIFGTTGPTSVGDPLGCASAFGMKAAVGFGASPLSETPHLQVELGVPLRFDDGFFDDDVFGPDIGPGTGVYSPDPQFWGSNVANDTIDPPQSFSIITIDPGGGTTQDASQLLVPEPTSLAIFGAGLTGLAFLRRRKRQR